MKRKTLLTILFIIFIMLNITLLYFVFIEPERSENLQVDTDIPQELVVPEGGFDVTEPSEGFDTDMEEDNDVVSDENLIEDGDFEEFEEDNFDLMEELYD